MNAGKMRCSAAAGRSISGIALLGRVSSYRNGRQNPRTEAANCVHSFCKVPALLSRHLSLLTTQKGIKTALRRTTCTELWQNVFTTP